MVRFPSLTIYSIGKKYVTINIKENTASTLHSIIFLHTQSHFIVFDFAIKTLLIIVFYFRWRMLVDSLIFELSNLSPLKGTKKENLELRKKRRDQQYVNH